MVAGVGGKMKFNGLTNQQFCDNFKTIVGEERRITTEVLHYFREAERRMLYAEAGYSSLHEFAVKELKYSGSAADRRIKAMRMIREIPEVEGKIQSGNLSLTTVLQAQIFFQQKAKLDKKKTSREEKLKTLSELENL